MVLKIGIDQITRSQWEWVVDGGNLISANYVNPGAPKQDGPCKGDRRFNYGFNDFIVVECTPELAYQVHGALEKDVELPPEHPRAWRRKTADPPKNMDAALLRPYTDLFSGKIIPTKSRSGYRTMAYGWGSHGDVLDLGSTTQYCDVEGPEPDGMSGEPPAKFIPLLIPGGLSANDTFWIDLNKGVRALYFPARFVYANDFPNDAGYAKISFVEEGSRNLIDASALIFDQSLSRMMVDNPIDLTGITRKTAETIRLNKAYHVGAYSFDSTLIVNVPAFLEASYHVSTGNFGSAAPHDAVYLAKSASIKATRLPPTPDGAWSLPPDCYTWSWHTQQFMRSYSAEISRSEQINLQEVTTSDIGAGTEFAVNILLMAASLVPYVGPLVSTMGSTVLEKMKDIRIDSSAEEAEAIGISGKTWGSIPGESKDKLVAKLKVVANLLIKARK